MSFLEKMPGPDFLAVYFGWFAVTWVGMLVVRHWVSDSVWTSLTGLMAFEALGVARFLIGSAHGMHTWNFLFMMMGFGALFFVLRADNLGNGDGSGSSCGGGCGGGGCGGGGCGGCGG